MKSGKVVSVVPARLGSKRVKLKSLRLLNGKPLIEYILDTLKQTTYLNDVYINSDSDYFGEIAKRNNVKFYKRRAELATSESLIDEYLYDFMKSVSCNYLAVVSPTSPFISATELDNAWEYYAKHDIDTLLSCEKIQTHCFFKGEPINFTIKGKHPRSQDIEPIRALNFAIILLDTAKYIRNYESNGYGVYTGNLGFYDTEGYSNIDIDYEDDFIFAEHVAQFMSSGKTFEPKYSDVVSDLISKNIKTEN